MQPLRRPLSLAAPAPRGRARRDADCRRSSPACRCRRARASRAAASSLRASARCSPSTARRGSASRAFEEGIAAAASGPAQPVLVSVFLEGGADALSVLSPQGDPLYRKLRPQLALTGGTVFAEDDRLHWHPAAQRHSRSCTASRRSRVMPAIGYTNADQSHFTSRHYWEVGATSTNLRTGWLGRYLDRVGTMDNPLQGLSLDDTLAPALATAKVPVASIDGPDQYDFWSNRVWGEVETRMLARDRRPRRAAGGDPAFAAAGRRHRAGRPPAQPAAPVPGRRRQARLHEPGRRTRSRRTRSRAGSQVSPRCSRAACRCASSR